MPQLNIATFNIWGSRNPEAVRLLQERLHIDVFALQEVDNNAARSRHLNVAEYIAGGRNWAFSESVRFGYLKPTDQIPYKAPANGTTEDATSGVALVSTKAFTSKRIDLGPQDQDYWSKSRLEQREIEPRSAIVGCINVENGRNLWVIATHLSYTKDRNLSSQFRAAQIALLNNYIATRIPRDEPLIVMGDFNATPQNPDMKPMMEQFRMAQTLTYPVGDQERPDRQIDYILLRGIKSAGNVRSFAFPRVSDHKLVMTTVQI